MNYTSLGNSVRNSLIQSVPVSMRGFLFLIIINSRLKNCYASLAQGRICNRTKMYDRKRMRFVLNAQKTLVD
jgi:hypothetical protein